MPGICSLCCFLFHFHLRDDVCFLSKPIFIQRPKLLPLCFDLKRNMYLPEAIWCSKTPIKINLFTSLLWAWKIQPFFFFFTVSLILKYFTSYSSRTDREVLWAVGLGSPFGVDGFMLVLLGKEVFSHKVQSQSMGRDAAYGKQNEGLIPSFMFCFLLEMVAWAIKCHFYISPK